MFPNQGSNPCPLHGKADSSTAPPGKSEHFFFYTEDETGSDPGAFSVRICPGAMQTEKAEMGGTHSI